MRVRNWWSLGSVSVPLLYGASVALAQSPKAAPPLAASSSPAPLPAPIDGSSPASRRVLVAWTPGSVRCEGAGTLTGEALRRPLSTLNWGGGAERSFVPAPVTVQFDIDPAGRAVSIADKRAFGDFGPALAASAFPAKASRGCSVTYTAAVTPIASAPVADLVSYTISPISGALPAEGWLRIRGQGSCWQAPRPQPLLRAYPDFRRVAGTPGVRDWAGVAYDLDAGGKPIHVRAADSNGNAALTDAAVKAVSASRFSGGARQGCFYPYWREPEAIRAPAMPDKSAFGVTGAACPGDGRNWATPPVMRYPDAYRRRKIEGWAVVRYDVAPWGAVGNVQVLAAQPAEQFGLQAVRNLEAARFAPSSQGASGCIERIRFAMPKDGKGEGGADDAAEAPSDDLAG